MIHEETPGPTLDGAVDKCPHSFAQLAGSVLPGLMRELRESMESPIALTDIASDGVAAMLARLSLNKDFAGCYVFLDAAQPVYVGISRRVFKRLREHVCTDTHNSATLAYLMAKRQTEKKTEGESQTPRVMWRAEAMKDERFLEVFNEKRDYLRSLSAAFVAIDNALVRHVFEPYAAQELRTGKWNSFNTH